MDTIIERNHGPLAIRRIQETLSALRRSKLPAWSRVTYDGDSVMVSWDGTGAGHIILFISLYTDLISEQDDPRDRIVYFVHRYHGCRPPDASDHETLVSALEILSSLLPSKEEFSPSPRTVAQEAVTLTNGDIIMIDVLDTTDFPDDY